jgi:hypothetical protein
VDERGVNDTQPGFDRLTMNDGGFPATTATFDGITIDVDPVGVTWGDHDRHRSTPPNSPGLTTAALYRDFVFGPRNNDPNGGIDITLSGLIPSAPYYATIWSFDTGSTGNRVSDWSANGVEVVSNYAFNGSVLPTSDGDNTLSFQADSDGAGTLLISGRGDLSGDNAPSVFFNAITLSDEPPPPPPSEFKIDIDVGTPPDTEPGWTSLPVSGASGSVDVTGTTFQVFSADDSRVRGGPNPLTRDFVFDDGGGQAVGLQVFDLPPGIWEASVWAWDNDYAVGDLIVGITQFGPPEIIFTNSFSASPTDPFTFQFDSSTLANGFGIFTRENNANDRARFNALQLVLIPEVIPEPSTLLIWSLLAGLGVGLGWRRRTK